MKITNAENVAAEAQNFEEDFDEFIGFAYAFLDNLKDRWWEHDKNTMKICKQILFPSNIQLTPNKIFIYQKSARYTDTTKTKQPPKGLN